MAPRIRPAQEIADHGVSAEQRLSNAEEVERLLEGLDATEAEVVRQYHLQGHTYQEISTAVGVPENSIGPILSPRGTRCVRPERARKGRGAKRQGRGLHFADLHCRG